jgi:hypothetical protein
VRLAAFQRAVKDRIESLHAGEHVDGEEVVARLIAETDEPRDVDRGR